MDCTGLWVRDAAPRCSVVRLGAARAVGEWRRYRLRRAEQNRGEGVSHHCTAARARRSSARSYIRDDLVGTKTSPPTATAAPPCMPARRAKLSELHADPGNVRSHSDRNLDAISDSLKSFGQV